MITHAIAHWTASFRCHHRQNCAEVLLFYLVCFLNNLNPKLAISILINLIFLKIVFMLHVHCCVVARWTKDGTLAFIEAIDAWAHWLMIIFG